MDWFAFFAHPLFIASAPATIAGGLAWFAGRHRIKQLESQIGTANSDLSRKVARIQELERTGRDSDALDTQARAYKSALISRLNDLLEFGNGSRATLYLPVNDSEGEFLGLLILCTAPTNLADSSFHGTVFSGRDAHAMQSYLNREIVSSQGSMFRFDEFSPTATYADCVFQPGANEESHPVGVVQILFDSAHDMDLDRCKSAVARVSPGIVEDLQFFLTDTRERLALIGLNIPEQSKRGVVLFFDISNSSQLFTNEARVSVTMTVMKRFMEIGVSTITAEGGVIEGFTGDGFIASFTVNADPTQSNVFERALRASHKLLDNAQEALKPLRPKLGDDFDAIKPRVGMATGVVHGISFAFGQMRVASVIGRSASNASIVCNSAPRNRPCITMDKATWLELPDHLRSSFEEMPAAGLSPKAQKRQLSVYVSKTPD